MRCLVLVLLSWAAATGYNLETAVLNVYHQQPDAVQKLNESYLYHSTVARVKQQRSLKNQKSPGRPKKLADDVAKEAMHVFLQGNGKEGQSWWGFTSIAHALWHSARLREIQSEAGITAPTLWRRIKQAHAKEYGAELKKLTIRWRSRVDPAVKGERLAKAREWLSWGAEKLLHVVWIDEKQEYLKEQQLYRCYGPYGRRSFQVESPSTLSEAPKIKYEAAVSAFAGPLYLRCVSGTTGYDSGYVVRT